MLPLMVLSMDPGGEGPKRARNVIGLGLALVLVGVGIVRLLPPVVSACLLGILIAAVVAYVALIAMPRAAQISIIGAALGVTADGGYAKLSQETPVTIANGIVKLADALVTGLGLIAKDAHVAFENAAPYGVWSFILSMAVFMLLSFLIKHDG